MGGGSASVGCGPGGGARPGTVAERLGDRLQVLAFGSHTRAEVRVWTVRDRAVRVHALAVDAVARETLPAMTGWDILPHPGLLPEALTRAMDE